MKLRDRLPHKTRSTTDILRDFIDNYYRLIVSTVLVFVTALLMHDRGSVLQDEYTAGIIAVTLFLACMLMLSTTQRWTWRAAGIFFVFAGDVQLYGYTLAALHGAKNGPPRGWELAFVRASLAVGGTLFFLGVLKWGIDKFLFRRPVGRGDVLNWLDSREGLFQ